MVNENAQLVPLVELSGQKFLVDIDNRQFVDNNDLNHCIDMHSKKGRELVNEMLGVEWRTFGIYPRDEDGMKV